VNIAKNMEAIFIVTLALTCATAFAATQETPAIPEPVAVDENMVVITMVGKRLTAAEKAALDS
jgi:hypothetical protein